MHRIALLPFTIADFHRLKSWLNNEKQLIQFAGPLFDFPLTDAQLNAYLHMDDKQPFKVVLKETNEIIGHCEFNFEEEAPVLSRILIGEENMRGNGLGEAIVIEMTQQLFANAKTEKIYLYVFDWNFQAISCYRKVGFEVQESLTTYLNVGNEKWSRLKMKLDRGRFEQTLDT